MPQVEHALFAPSSSARVVACPGSVTMCQQVTPVPQDDKASREGTASHWALSELLLGRDVCIGQVAPNGITLNDEMIEGAEQCAEYILTRDSDEARLFGLVEEPLPPGDLHYNNWGTPDYRMFSYVKNILYIDDYKYGHKYVEVFENWQLINYALLALQQLGINGYDDQTLIVVMTIHQPRSYHKDGPHRNWTVKAAELRPYANILRAAFAEASKPDAMVNARDLEQCEYCSARWACPAATAAGYRAMDMAYESSPLVMSHQALGIELMRLRAAQDALNARETGLSAQILAMITQGVDVPYFGIDHGAARTVWKEGAQEGVAHLAAVLGIPGISKPSVVTPAQAIKAGLPEAIVKDHSFTPRGAAKLVKVDGKRAAKEFAR